MGDSGNHTRDLILPSGRHGDTQYANGYGIDLSFSYGGQIDGNLIAGNPNGGITLYYGTVTVSNNQIGGAGSLQNGGDGLEID